MWPFHVFTEHDIFSAMFVRTSESLIACLALTGI